MDYTGKACMGYTVLNMGYRGLHVGYTSRPSRGRGKEGLVHTACACAIILQNMENPITYGYLYTYLVN